MLVKYTDVDSFFKGREWIQYQMSYSKVTWNVSWVGAGGVGHGPRDQFCPITLLQMADCFFFTFVRRPFDFLRFLPFVD